MASNILQVKRSSSYDSDSDPSSLAYGELAWSNDNQKLFVGRQTDSNGTTNPFHLSTLKDIIAGNGITKTVSSGDADNRVTIAIASTTAGDGLGHSSGVLSVNVDDSSIETNSDAIRVKASGVTNAMLAGSIANAKLANSSVTVSDGSNNSAIALGSTLTFAGVANETDVSENNGTVTVGVVSNPTLTGNVTVTGNLQVDGTTTTVNSTTVTIDDPIFTMGGDGNGTNDDKDRGIEFKWHNGSSAKVGFFGMDDTDNVFRYIPDATNTSEVFSGSVGNAEFASIKATAITDATIECGTF
tara:strand:+ start:15562 stop:16458 length:897 start_codon:yes stop_codon:yes gene_type:complete